MSSLVAKALEGGSKVIVEAGTGVGKSLAYLFPAARWATTTENVSAGERSRKVVIATYTKALQHQLVKKDLPVVAKALANEGIGLRFSLLMGSENYACLQRLHQAVEGGADLLIEGPQLKTLERMTGWAAKAGTGLRSEIPFDISNQTWGAINRDPDICLGKKGPYATQCLYRQDLERARNAHILIVNHHLLLNGLPEWLDFDALIIDEAHNLEDVATQTFGTSLSIRDLRRLLNDTFHPTTRRGLLARIGGLSFLERREIRSGIRKAEVAGKEFFDSLREKLKLTASFDIGEGIGAKRVLTPGIVPDELSPLLTRISNLLQKAILHSKSKEEESQTSALVSRYLKMAEAIGRFLKCDDKTFAYWAELRKERNIPTTSFHIRPIEISEFLKKYLFERSYPVVLTSATLSVDRSLVIFRERVGIGECEGVVLDSPFNYKENARLAMPHGFPDPSNDEIGHIAKTADLCEDIIEAVPGGILFLFTSWKGLINAANSAKAIGLSRPIFVQGDSDPDRLLNDFRAAGDGLLFATETFWQGVDVPGEALSCVVMSRLPFTPPQTPLEQARHELFASRGQNYFRDYALPRAVIKFKQGFGRLIRSETDRGIFFILDPRTRTKKYGRVFLNSLPNIPEVSRFSAIRDFLGPRQIRNAIFHLIRAKPGLLSRTDLVAALESKSKQKSKADALVLEENSRLLNELLDSGELELRKGRLHLP